MIARCSQQGCRVSLRVRHGQETWHEADGSHTVVSTPPSVRIVAVDGSRQFGRYQVFLAEPDGLVSGVEVRRGRIWTAFTLRGAVRLGARKLAAHERRTARLRERQAAADAVSGPLRATRLLGGDR